MNKSNTNDRESTKSLRISPKQRRIVKAKIKGLKNPEIGKLEYPHANPTSQRQLVSRQLKKPNVAQYYEQSKLQALKEHNITWSRIIRPITDALEATNKEGEIDHNTRLRASKQAIELIQSKDMGAETPHPQLNLPNVDEVQLIRILNNNS